MYYVYILQSLKDKSYYTGSTFDLKKRLEKHNNGEVKYSRAHKPFILVWYSAFLRKERAIMFELYLKQGSGSAFSKKHLI